MTNDSYGFLPELRPHRIAAQTFTDDVIAVSNGILLRAPDQLKILPPYNPSRQQQWNNRQNRKSAQRRENISSHHLPPNLAPAKFLSDFQYPPQKSPKNPVSVADTHTPE